MKNEDKWQPSKYVYRKGKLVASKECGVSSRLMVNLLAGWYDNNLRKYAKGRLLDLGCGQVPLYLAYKDFVEDITCVDWDHSFHENIHLDYTCDLTKTLPFANGSFDTIILSDVLEHIPNPDLLWNEIYRILAVNGVIIMNVPFFYMLHERPYDYFRYTEFMLRRFVEASNLDLVLIDCIGGSLEVLADFCAKHLRFIPLIGECIALIVQHIVLLFSKTDWGKNLSNISGIAFPFGYFLIAEKKGA